MYGWIQDCIEALVLENFGATKWAEIKKSAGISEANGEFVRHKYYPDSVTYNLVAAASKILELSTETILKTFGEFFVDFIAKAGYKRLLQAQGSNLLEFLQNMNTMHYHLQGTLPELVPPDFSAERTSDGKIILHYWSERELLAPLVEGVVTRICTDFFDSKVKFDPYTSEKVVIDGATRNYTRFAMKLIDTRSMPMVNANSVRFVTQGDTKSGTPSGEPLALDGAEFARCFPFHLAFSKNMEVLHVGVMLQKLSGIEIGDSASSALTVQAPHGVKFKPDSLDRVLHTYVRFSVNGSPEVLLTGGVVKVTSGYIFLGSLEVNTLSQLQEFGFTLSDLPVHDATRKVVLQGEQLYAEIKSSAHMEQVNMELAKKGGATVDQNLHTEMKWFLLQDCAMTLLKFFFSFSNFYTDLAAYVEVSADNSLNRFHDAMLVLTIIASVSTLFVMATAIKEIWSSGYMLITGKLRATGSSFSGGDDIIGSLNEQVICLKSWEIGVLMAGVGFVFDELPLFILQFKIIQHQRQIAVGSVVLLSLLVSLFMMGMDAGQLMSLGRLRDTRIKLMALVKKHTTAEASRLQKFRNSTYGMGKLDSLEFGRTSERSNIHKCPMAGATVLSGVASTRAVDDTNGFNLRSVGVDSKTTEIAL